MSLSKSIKMENLRASIRKVTRLLTESRMPVIMAGTQAKVSYDPSTGKPIAVYLPSLPDNASEQLINAVQGFVDHEVAHVLFSDFEPLMEGQKMKIPFLLNAVEDSFIERKIMEVYEGTKNNVANMRDLFIDKFIEPEVQKAKKAGITDFKQWWALLGVCAIRAWAGHLEFEIYMDDKWELLGNIPKLALDKKIPERLQAITCTNDSLKVAIRISHIVKDAEKMPPPKEGSEEPTEDSEEPAEDSEEPAEDSEEPAEDSEEPTEDSEEESKEDSEEPTEPTEDSEEPTEDSDGEGVSPEDLDLEEESEEDKDKKGEKDEIEGGEPTLPANGFNDGDMKGIEDFLGDVISEEAKQATDASNYTPYTRDGDVIEPLQDEEVSSALIDEMEVAIRKTIAPVQRALANAFESSNKKFEMHGKRSGTLSGPSLHRLVSNDERVYFQTTETKTRESAVQLVIDISGSMSGRKIKLAAQVAWALTEVLDRLKISCEVICFTQLGVNTMEKSLRESFDSLDYSARSAGKFSRFGPLYMPILKSWEEPHFTQKHKRNFTRMSNGELPMQGNVDGESLQYAGVRLASRKEPGKVMIVLSDGQPAGDGYSSNFSAHLKQVVKDLTRSGINVVGIGINNDSVSNYYPKHVVVKGLDDLAGTVMARVREALLKS